MSSSMMTLYEDWRQRREHLASAVTGQVHREACLRILDALLARRREAAEAAAAARFPFRQGMMLTHRASVVHHYLGGGAAIRAQTQPSIRAAVILGRIAALHPQSKPAGRAGGASDWLLAQVEACSVYWSSGYWQNELLAQIGRAIQATLGQRFVYLTILDRLQLGPKLPDSAIMYMFERLDNPGLSGDSAAGLFVCCENECVLDYAVLAWRDRLAANGPDSVTRGLNQVLFRPHWRARAGDKIRAELASHNAGVRIGAADLLTHLGGLHDVALFLDLLSLPPTRDEDPAERDTLLRAAATLAGAEDVVSVSGTSAAGAAAGTGPTTRYDDWLLRRRRLTHLKPLQHPYVEEHRAVLDALLECCRNTEAGAKPARFPAPPQSFVSRRAVVVYHQLGRAEVRGNVTETDAGKHASSILQRIARLDPQSHARSYAASGVVRTGEEPAAAQGPAVVTEAQAEIWKELENEIAIRGFKSHANIVYRLIEDALNLGTRLPEKAVYYLAQHLYNPLAIELLGRCSNASVLEYMYGAWRERMSRRRRGPLRLVEFFVLPAWREKAAERFRRELAGGEDSRTRVLTARAVGRLGTLDDVGLLSDLMSLPRSANEDARERPALLAAMRRLARRALDTLPASI